MVSGMMVVDVAEACHLEMQFGDGIAAFRWDAKPDSWTEDGSNCS